MADDLDPRPDARLRGRARLDAATAALQELPDVSVGVMFGSEGYSVRGKLFAFVSSRGDLVVKLDAERIDDLALDHMVMHGRPMREWAVVPAGEDDDRWRAIAAEAHAFVDEITP
ncbi:hypothetical protein ACDF64_09305 [Agromyces sp. MMS24-JH15]|uniref:hypothetical protein n=1 Tax=Agromyces sp. MMS24-JH15 TaxID=3243765 RepID=UPI0037484DCF